MKLLLIRHGKVDMKREKYYSPEEYNMAQARYDEADILPVKAGQGTGDYERIYVSSLRRTQLTAEQLFPSAPPSMLVRTALLDEVPLSAFCSTPKRRPWWMYDVFGRLQWRFGKGQKESYAETRERADRLIAELEKKNENAILITHGFFMNVLIRRLKRRGRYEIYRSGMLVIHPLEKIKVIDRQPH